MANVQLTILFVTILAGSVVLFFMNESRIKAKLAAFTGRDELTLEQFYERYYAASGVSSKTVGDVLSLVEIETEIPAKLLRPGDRFGIELADPKGWEFDDGVAAVSSYARQVLGEGKLSAIQTLDDLIRAVERVADKPQFEKNRR